MSFDILANGIRFSQERWREAILFYLFEIWSRLLYRPKIRFGSITLRLDSTQGKYYADGENEDQGDLIPTFLREEILVVTPKQTEVEIGLVRFVKNNRIKQLKISFSDDSRAFTLWKKARRSQYGVKIIGVPLSTTSFLLKEES